MGERELPAILQSHRTESAFGDSSSEAAACLTVAEHAEAILGF